MDITFEAIGLSFDAEVDYTPVIPGRYSGPPEDCHPDEGGEVEFETLTCKGKDAMFLLDSAEVAESIYDAACVAAEEACRNEDFEDFDL